MLKLNPLSHSKSRRRLAALSAVLAFAAFPACPQPQSRAAWASPTTRPTPVIVELFTSEGCSDCPPADTLLADLSRTQPVPGAEIIPLEEHVNYWNHGGWADPFSSAVVTSRQSAYSDRARSDEVYTPEMVVDGRQQFVGSDRSTALQAIRGDAALSTAQVELSNVKADSGAASFQVNVSGLDAGFGDDVFTALTEDDLVSHVGGGENGGRVLRHSAVVRSLSVAGTVFGQSGTMQARLPLASGWKRGRCKLIAFVQERGTGKILCATETAL